MTIRRVFLLCLFAICAFGYWIWPGAWVYKKSNGITFRTDRFTGKVQKLTDHGWEPIGKKVSDQSSSNSSISIAEQLEAVDGQLGFQGINNSEFGGEVYNGSVRPIVGEVIFHVIVKDKKGTEVANRRIRQKVDWAAQQTAFVNFRPAWSFDPEQESFEWHVEPVEPEKLVHSEAGISFYEIYNGEYEARYDGQKYLITVDLSKQKEINKKVFAKMVKLLLKHKKNKQ